MPSKQPLLSHHQQTITQLCCPGILKNQCTEPVERCSPQVIICSLLLWNLSAQVLVTGVDSEGGLELGAKLATTSDSNTSERTQRLRCHELLITSYNRSIPNATSSENSAKLPTLPHGIFGMFNLTRFEVDSKAACLQEASRPAGSQMRG